ncbi:hypothetical protein PQQ96_23740 [Paraburkholderia sediminicola]|uniref:hypothetical protein n=1 Tax=Paraburkholderia sediminicola TaxID=458836 RepID=UPI0038B70847
MNSEKFQFLLGHVALHRVIPVRIDFTLSPTFEPFQIEPAYTRVNWATGDIHVAEMELETPEGPQQVNLMRFHVTTRTRLVRVGEGGVPPDSQEPEESNVWMDATVEFMLEYGLRGCKHEDLDQDAISEFSAKNVPHNMWPYFREMVQNLATRAQLPIPTIPPFRIPTTHQPASK